MPEYLAPGVFVEEVSFRQKTIEGVSTSTTGFVGPARFGPTEGEPPLLTSFSDFERIYGGLDNLRLGGTESPNYLAHAVRAYFDEGGKRLYVARLWNPTVDSPAFSGHSVWPTDPVSPDPGFGLRARHPGRAGDMRVALAFKLGENALHDAAGGPELRGVAPFDTVLATPVGSPPGQAELYWAERIQDPVTGVDTFRLRDTDPGAPPPSPELALDQFDAVRVVSVSVVLRQPGRFADEQTFPGLTFHPAHRAAITRAFTDAPERRSTFLYTPLVMETALANGAAIAGALTALPNAADGTPVIDVMRQVAADPFIPSAEALTARLALSEGDDGDPLIAADYAGQGDAPKTGLAAFEDLEDISIVAAPGASADAVTGPGVIRQLIGHAERMRYRIAVLDSVEGMLPAEVRALRGTIDSTRAALYYPWVVVDDPLADGEPRELRLPPSGFVAGIYARNDVERGVHKAPANEVVRLASNFEFLINQRQQEALNPEGINCLRFFEGRGFRVWGARTASSDPEWKYVNVRRYFAFLERSIEKGTQWAVFEPNGPRLWANIQRTVEDFLYNEFVSNHLAGRKPAEAFFVRCDETTMTQNDRDNGRLICLIGVAPLRPAEFVIFRIGQKTADARG
ncbi:MAG: phage tail sheath subtilisin-like domain-containing protein [Pseudomonadota bacterium]|nr:phage tail sheath subtilisin-like domain-containing protein [Pseudomonadota bacterium]